jgi:hypothetical protein
MTSSLAFVPPEIRTRVRFADRTTASTAAWLLNVVWYVAGTASVFSGCGKLTFTTSAPSSLAVRAA